MANQAERVVALAGGTGLVGGMCLRLLVEAPGVSRVVAVGRRAPEEASHAKVKMVEVHNFDHLATVPEPGPLSAGICALGTTIKKAKSQQAFRAVDHDAVLSFARWVRAHGGNTFVLVSSVGASAQSSNFYLRVKGEAEQALATVGFDRLILLRPSLLLGAREESRPGEAIARAVMPVLGRLLLGPFERYRGIPAHTVARALVTALDGQTSGVSIWYHGEILAAAR